MKIIEANNLIKTYTKSSRRESFRALDEVSFSLESGKVLGIIGPNGSGKTTLFKCLLGLIRPDKGSSTLFENRYQGLELKSKIGFLYEKTSLYQELTPEEILSFFGKLYRISGNLLKHRIDESLELVDLTSFKKTRIRGFSKGMVQRLGIALCLINDAELLIFDELISGLDPFGVHKINQIILNLIQRKKTLVISSHMLSHIEDLCTDILMLYKGKILKQGTLQDFASAQKNFHIDLNVRTPGDPEKALALLTGAGFQVSSNAYTSRDLENIFISMIHEQKNSEDI